MGRNKIYNTNEERLNAEKEHKKRSYNKHKTENRDKYRFSSLRTYYRGRLKRDGLTEEKIEEYKNKIEDLTQQLERLKNMKEEVQSTNGEVQETTN